jgi:hypothetical protein
MLLLLLIFVSNGFSAKSDKALFRKRHIKAVMIKIADRQLQRIYNEFPDKEGYLTAVKRTWVGLVDCLSDKGWVGRVQPCWRRFTEKFLSGQLGCVRHRCFLACRHEVIKL